jgi:hypothetical protein
MGLFDWLRKPRDVELGLAELEREAQVRAEREIAEARERFLREQTAWDQEQSELEKEIRLASEPEGFVGASDIISIMLHKQESVFLVGQGAALIEPKRLPGAWVGGYAGLSFRIIKGVTAHVGGSRGQYIPGPDVPAPIATGTATITNQRIVFQSDQHAREWAFSKLLGYQHDPNKPVTFFQVSNRQTVSGIGYSSETARMWRFRLSLALAHFRSEVPGLLAHLKQEMTAHEAAKPQTPTEKTPPGHLTEL